jgi:RNase P subunit RPR2
VAPQHDIYELFRDYAQAQLDIGNGKMMVVQRSMKHCVCSDCVTPISSL